LVSEPTGKVVVSSDSALSHVKILVFGWGLGTFLLFLEPVKRTVFHQSTSAQGDQCLGGLHVFIFKVLNFLEIPPGMSKIDFSFTIGTFL
jgi:hypothetical protein